MHIIIVDTNDTELGSKDIEEVDFANEIYRVSAALLKNDRGEVLLAQRAFDKRHSPGAWGPSAAGMHEPGETYDSNAVKELQEEIGMTRSIDELVRGPKVLTHNTHPVRHYFTQWYTAACNTPAGAFVLEDEVAAVRWMAPGALARELQAHPEQFIDINLEVIEQL